MMAGRRPAAGGAARQWALAAQRGGGSSPQPHAFVHSDRLIIFASWQILAAPGDVIGRVGGRLPRTTPPSISDRSA